MEAPEIAETLLDSTPDEILELDELWSYVYEKADKRWLWIALCRRTKQVVAFFSRRQKRRKLSTFMELDSGQLQAQHYI